MSAGRSAVVDRVKQARLLPLRAFLHLRGSQISLAALFGLAAILLIFRGPALERNLGAAALLKCELLAGVPTLASTCPPPDSFSTFAPPLLQGVLAYRSGEGRTALPHFEQARAAHPSDPLAVFWLASAAYRSGDQADAILSWKALGPRKLAAFFTTRSKVALENGDMPFALEQAQIAVAVDPTCGEAVLQLGRVYFQRGDLEEADNAILEALRLDLSPRDRGSGHHALGEIGHSQGREQQALNEYRLAVEFALSYPTPLYSAAESYLFRRDLADQYTRLHLHPEAKALLADLLAGNPSDASLLVRMGNLSLEQNEYAEAERWYQAAVSADSGSGAGEAALGRLYRQKRDLDQAAAFFQKSIELNPDNHWVFASLGGIYWQQGSLDQAITAYRLVTIQSKDRLLLEDAWLSLARLYTSTGKKAQSRSAWESVLEINPANLAAQDALHKKP